MGHQRPPYMMIDNGDGFGNAVTMIEIELTVEEFAKLSDRLSHEAIQSGGARYTMIVEPVLFWTDKIEWDNYRLEALVARITSGQWQGLLLQATVNTLAKMVKPRKR